MTRRCFLMLALLAAVCTTAMSAAKPNQNRAPRVLSQEDVREPGQ